MTRTASSYSYKDYSRGGGCVMRVAKSFIFSAALSYFSFLSTAVSCGGSGEKDKQKNLSLSIKIIPMPSFAENSFKKNIEMPLPVFAEKPHNQRLKLIDQPQIEELVEQKVIDASVHRGAVLQSYEDGTTYSCALLSILTSYNACHLLEAIQVSEENYYSLQERPNFQELLNFYKEMHYLGKHGQEENGYLFLYTAKDFLLRQGYQGENLREFLVQHGAPSVHYSSKKIGNQQWLLGLSAFGMKAKRLDPRMMTKKFFKQRVREAIKQPGSVLMFHGFNHYTCIGGYRTLENGGLEVQVSFNNQKPDRWVPLIKLVENLKHYKNSRLFVVSKY